MANETLTLAARKALEFGSNRAPIRGLVERLTADSPLVPCLSSDIETELGLLPWPKFLADLATTAGLGHAFDTATQETELLNAVRDQFGELYVADALDASYGDHVLPAQIGGTLSLLPFLGSGLIVTAGLSNAVERSPNPVGPIQVWTQIAGFNPDLVPLPSLLKIRGDFNDRRLLFERGEAVGKLMEDLRGWRSLLYLGENALEEFHVGGVQDV